VQAEVGEERLERGQVGHGVADEGDVADRAHGGLRCVAAARAVRV
jgi:hypothetical protein